MKELPPGWGEDDVVITCYKKLAGRFYSQDVITLACELCGAAVAAAPVSAEQKKQPGWHIVCRECFATLPTPMAFAGRIKRGATELPEKKVL